ncbi:MAG: type II secretion system minor pseudopilin GspK [Pseudomonadota bacterium]
MMRASNAQSGAALLTVLMIVAAMSVAALAITKAVTDATQRSVALDSQAQLALYAVSAEEVAKARMAEVLAPLENKLFAEMPGLGAPQIIPVDGGAFTVTARDATNCFDVNTIATAGDEGRLVADAGAQEVYQSLLTATIEESYASDVAALVASLTDWMDANSVPGNGGAEDSYYLSESPSYRTSSQKLANIEELRAVRGYTPDILARIAPVICALPDGASLLRQQLNINTLTESHAPLMQAVLSDALSLEDVRSVIANRPQGGWPDVESLLEDPVVNRIDPSRIQTDRLGIVSSLVEVSANVSYRGHDMTMRYLFEAVPGRPIRTLRRERIG